MVANKEVIVSLLQRKLRTPQKRTNEIMAQLELLGIVGPATYTPYTESDDGIIFRDRNQELLVTSKEEIDLIFKNLKNTTDTKANVNVKSEYKQEGKTVAVFKGTVNGTIYKDSIVEPGHPNAKNTIWKIEEKNGRYFVSGLRDTSVAGEIATMSESLIKPVFNEDNIYKKNEPQVIFILEPAELQKNSDGSFTLLKQGLLRYHTLEVKDTRADATVVSTDTKYDESSEKIGKFVNEKVVSEETILDQLRKINSCFK